MFAALHNIYTSNKTGKLPAFKTVVSDKTTANNPLPPPLELNSIIAALSVQEKNRGCKGKHPKGRKFNKKKYQSVHHKTS